MMPTLATPVATFERTMELRRNAMIRNVGVIVLLLASLNILQVQLRTATSKEITSDYHLEEPTVIKINHGFRQLQKQDVVNPNKRIKKMEDATIKIDIDNEPEIPKKKDSAKEVANEQAEANVQVKSKQRRPTPKKKALGSDIVPTSPYAYSWILGGIDLNSPNYRGYFYGIMVAAYQLRRKGSKANMLLWVEFHKLNANQILPEPELNLLKRLNITLLQIPSMRKPSFYELQLQKFRILGLTQYRRVLHLDSDVLPTRNLDYLFEYSDPQSPIYQSDNNNSTDDHDTQNQTQQIYLPDRTNKDDNDNQNQTQTTLLEENFVINGPNDPSNGGFFMLAPHPGDLERIQRIIRVKEQQVAQSNNGKGQFNETYGWGQKLQDGWVGAIRRNHGTEWTWFAASGDQGLLYHWIAHVQRRFSLAAGWPRDAVERWLPYNTANATGSHDTTRSDHPDRDVQLVYRESVDLWPFSPKPMQAKGECFHGFCRCGPRADFYHFMGDGKPWKNKSSVPAWDWVTEVNKYKSPEIYWRYLMIRFNEEYELGLDLYNLGEEHSVPYKIGQFAKSSFTDLYSS